MSQTLKTKMPNQANSNNLDLPNHDKWLTKLSKQPHAKINRLKASEDHKYKQMSSA